MKKRGKLSAALGALTLAGATTLIVAGPAEANSYVAFDLTYDRSSPIIGWTTPDPICDDPEIWAGTFTDDNPHDVPFTDRLVFNDDRASGHFDLSGLESGIFEIEVECAEGPDWSTYYHALVPFSEVKIQKTVVGTAPADASFTVDLVCETFVEIDENGSVTPGPDQTYTFEFGPTGGTQYVYLLDAVVGADSVSFETACQAVETENGGADEVHYEGAEFQVMDTSSGDESMLLTIGGANVEITNIFNDPDDEPEPETPEVRESETPEVPGPESEAKDPGSKESGAAKPVSAQPKFTG